jgi:hypothetical protein
VTARILHDFSDQLRVLEIRRYLHVETSIIGGVVRKFILIVLLLVAPHSFAFAPRAPAQNAIDAFLKTQNDNSDPVLNAQISELMRAGYKERGTTGAVLLGGGCGVVGCNSTCLVTTVYSTPGANPRSTIVAAIVTSFDGKEFRVSRILTKAGIECLVNPK